MEKDIQRLLIARSSLDCDFDDDDDDGVGGNKREKNDVASKGKDPRMRLIRLLDPCDRFDQNVSPRSTEAAAMTAEELSSLKKEVDEDLKKMFQDGDEKKRKKT